MPSPTIILAKTRSLSLAQLDELLTGNKATELEPLTLQLSNDRTICHSLDVNYTHPSHEDFQRIRVYALYLLGRTTL